MEKIIGKEMSSHMKKVLNLRRKETTVSFRTSIDIKEGLERICKLHVFSISEVMNELLITVLKDKSGNTPNIPKETKELKKDSGIVFRTSFVLKEGLEKFCTKHNLDYTDVLNELLIQLLNQ